MKQIYLGPPGSGKGTVSSKLAPLFNVPHISTGELLRQNLKEGTIIGLKAKEYMERGELVPDEIVIEMLKDRIEKEDCEKGFILDGFPRTLKQAEMLHNLVEIDWVINLSVTDEVVVTRNSSRICCKNCGEIYNLRTLPTKEPGICDKCGGEVIRRKDDEPEIIKDRLKVYKEQTEPLVEFYKQKGLLKNVPCCDIHQTPNETIEEVLRMLIKELVENQNSKKNN